MKTKNLFILALVAILGMTCAPSEEQCAEQMVRHAHEMVQEGRYEAALRTLDSVHTQYPKIVSARRQAKALSDSIRYLEAQQTLTYSDSLLHIVTAQVDSVLPLFKYEKNESYEDHGRYVHRLLNTGSNTQRCFLQAYVRDDRVTQVKGYYYGAKAAKQQSVILRCGEDEARFYGSNHAFEAEGWHEILTLTDSTALGALNFIASHQDGRIRVQGENNTSSIAYTYYLQTNEKQALTDTYRLGFLMQDIRLLEQRIKTASATINLYQQRHHKGTDIH